MTTEFRLNSQLFQMFHSGSSHPCPWYIPPHVGYDKTGLTLKMTPWSNPDTRLFKLAILTILILIFITIAANKVWELRIAAERVEVMHTIGSLRSVLGMKMSEVVIKGGITALAALHKSNPMQLWVPPPNNYLGEFTTETAPKEIQGNWYFDINSRMLIYGTRFTDYFRSSNTQFPDLVRYQLRLSYKDLNHNNQFDPSSEPASGLNLQPVDHYNWLSQGDAVTTTSPDNGKNT